MKKILLFVFSLLLINFTSVADTGWFQDYVIINKNNTGSNHYWIGADPGFGTQLQSYNFGTVSSLVITGADMKYWSDTKDRTGGAFYYLIKSADGNTIHVPATEVIWTQSGPDGNNYQGLWTGTINLISTLSPSTSYQLHIYAKHWGTGQGDNWLSNGGANYVATFTTVAAPVAYNVTGTGSYCFGNAGLAVGLANSETGVTYTLYKGSEAQTPTINGTTGEAISFGIQPAGTYTVKGTRSVFTTDMTGNAVITEITIPTAVSAVANPNPICADATLTLTGAATGATSWSWTGPNDFASPDQNPQIANVTSAAAGVYSLIASNVCGAAEAVTTASVTVFSGIPTSVLASASPNPICAGATLTLAGTATDATSWSWTGPNDFASPDQNPQIANVTSAAAGVYLLIAGNACGAATEVSTSDVTVNPIVTASVTIEASANPVVSGTSVEFTATPVNGGTPLTTTYQWYINGNPAGFNQPTLTYNPLNNNTIYVVMTSSLPCTSPVQSTTITMIVTTAPANSTWDGSTDNDWHTAANWSDGVPGSTTNVIIPFTDITNFPTINSAAVCHNITLISGASILGNNKLSVTGDASVERLFTGNEWHLLSSPITNANTGMFTGKYLQYHNETDNKYYDILSADSVITVAKGYAIWGGSGFTKTFFGPLNDNDKSYSVKKAGAGWNLVGNPYPSYIDWNASGWTKTNVLGTTYRHVSNNASTGWATFNGTTGTNGGTRYIAPCQGFFVEASANGTLGMSNAVRTHETAPFYKSSEDVVPNLIRLEISGNGFKDDAVVYFTPTATPEFDGESDARKLFGDVAEAPQIYSFGPTPLAINTLRELASVPVGIHAGTNGTFTIAATEINDLKYVTLEDTKTGVFTELANKSYTFDFIAGENEQRFKLHFSSVGIDEKETTTANIYSYQQTVYVNLADNAQGDIYIYNLAGQLITAQESASGNVRIGLNSLGVYMVKVVTEKETLTQKVVIR